MIARPRMGWIAVFAACGVGGCGGSGASSGGHSSLTPGSAERAATLPGPFREVLADWDDVEAGVLAGVAACEMAVVAERAGEPGVRVFTLATVRDEPGELVCALLRPRQGDGPTTIGLRARVGRFGDAEREAALVAAVERRLRQLEGREFAPRR